MDPSEVARKDRFDLPHANLRPQCGFCERLIQPGEAIIVMLGNGNSTGYYKCIGPYIFPEPGPVPRPAKIRLLCRRPVCEECDRVHEASTEHYDCADLVAQHGHLKNSWEHLWTSTGWRQPWVEAPNLCLDAEVVLPELSVLDDCGIKGMSRLPPEVLHMIQQYSADSPIWRYFKAIDHSLRLSPAHEYLPQDIPLSEVVAWKRPDVPEVIEEGGIQELPLVRLTIDAKGVSEIERFSERPRFETGRTNALAFTFVDQESAEDILARFNFGIMRLKLPEGCRGLQIWDTPTPPDLAQCVFHPNNITETTRFHTIEISKITGITFFYWLDQVFAIHAHTKESPYAKTTYERLMLPRERKQSLVWVYLPLPETDSIAAFGTQVFMPENDALRTVRLLFRMKLAGEVCIGPPPSQRDEDFILSKSTPLTIIHNTAESMPVSTIGAYCGEEKDNAPIAPFKHFAVDDALFLNACYSIARLEDVCHVSIFRPERRQHCVGLLLQYKNGAQRALGQCRLGVDRVEHCTYPTHICLYPRFHLRQEPGQEHPMRIRVTMVEATAASSHTHEGGRWVCCTMEGDLEFWFSDVAAKLLVTVDEGLVESMNIDMD